MRATQTEIATTVIAVGFTVMSWAFLITTVGPRLIAPTII